MFPQGGYGCGYPPCYPCGGYQNGGTGIIWIIIVIAVLFFIFFGSQRTRPIF